MFLDSVDTGDSDGGNGLSGGSGPLPKGAREIDNTMNGDGGEAKTKKRKKKDMQADCLQ